MTRVDRYGFPRQSAKRFKVVKGFRTGDLIKAVVPTGKKDGTHTTDAGTIQGISYKYCKTIQKGDGYGYTVKKAS